MLFSTFKKKRTLFVSRLDQNLRRTLVKCYIWSIELYGAETWTLRKIDKKYVECFEMWCWERMKKVIDSRRTGMSYIE